MSKTLSSRTSQVSQRGRGRGSVRANSQSRQPLNTGEKINTVSRSEKSVSSSVLTGSRPSRKPANTSAPKINRTKMAADPSNESTAPDVPGEQQPQTFNSSGFTVFSPNEKKRQQIAQQAKREEEAYLAYQNDQRQKAKQCNNTGKTVGTVGGSASEDEVRRRQMQAQRNAKLTNLDKHRKWKEEARRKENEEIQQRLSQARAQTIQNEERQRTNWDKDRRRKNEMFLRRLESQAQSAPPEGGEEVSHKQEKVPHRQEMMSHKQEKVSHRQEKMSHRQEKISPKGKTAPEEQPRVGMGACNYMYSGNETESYRMQRGAHRNESESAKFEHASSLRECEGHPLEGRSQHEIEIIFTLQDMFPAYTLDNLIEIAEQAEYSPEKAAALLAD